MIIYNIKGNPYGLKVEICARAAGLNVPVEEVTPNGMCTLEYCLRSCFLGKKCVYVSLMNQHSAATYQRNLRNFSFLQNFSSLRKHIHNLNAINDLCVYRINICETRIPTAQYANNLINFISQIRNGYFQEALVTHTSPQ